MGERERERDKVRTRKTEWRITSVPRKEEERGNGGAIRKSLEKIQLVFFGSQVTAGFRHPGRSWRRGRKKEE